jgi:hypothetical protein
MLRWECKLFFEQQTIALQVLIIYRRLLIKVLAARVVCGIDVGNAEIKGTRDTINQAYANASDLLTHHIALRLDDHAVICTDELTDGHNDRLPIARLLSIQTVLVQIGRHNRLGLDIDEIFASVALDFEGNVAVRVEIPQALAEQIATHISCAPGSIAGPLDLRFVGGKFIRDCAVEADVWRVLCVCGNKVEVDV